MKPHLVRQHDLIPESCLGERITIVGAGAVGGHTTMALTKMGFHNISVWDFDEVSVENMSSQPYRFSDIGKPKVESLREIVRDFSGVEILANNIPWESGKVAPFEGIVVAAVDSMTVRKALWRAHKGLPGCRAFIDPRMGAETALLFAMRPCDDRDVEGYEKSLYSDSSAVQEPCTAKATMYCAVGLSALVSKCVKDIASNSDYVRTATWSLKESQLTAWKASQKK